MRLALPVLVAAFCVFADVAVVAQGLVMTADDARQEAGAEGGEGGGGHLREWGNGGAKEPEDDEAEQEGAEEATTEELKNAEAAPTEELKEGFPQRTRVDLFYETECPDCMKTISEELQVFWADEALRDRIELVMHPFGNAMVIPVEDLSDGYKFWHDVTGKTNIFVCQHGESECLGNMIQACIMHMKEDDPVRFLPYIFCMEGKMRSGVEKKSQECAEELGIVMAEVKSCAEGSEGEALMTAIGLRTTEQRINHVPWILIDGTHIESAEDGEFLRTLCGVWGQDQPAACRTAPRKTKEEEPVPQQSRGPSMLLHQSCEASPHPFPMV